ncbi:zinc finger BED domain-containing protein 6-like [Aphis craccivora]|uniref:Zinc finger BED domain-containing protein 6-like n=1 Tax=Aphis craccivora TaxID=307492 RepID=A0A6G0WB65_APHCR|nr:zinc finger BED domain-containing protein 6-like [Aphis craccivora]
MKSGSVDNVLSATTNTDVDSPTEPVLPLTSNRTIQKTIISSFSAIFGFKEGGQNHTAVTSSLVYMIVKDNMPLNTVEKIDGVTPMSATLNMKSLQESHKADYLSSVLLKVCNE